MPWTKRLLEGLKLIAIFATLVLVIWTMPEHTLVAAQH